MRHFPVIQKENSRGENPGEFPKVVLILQQPFSLPHSAQTLAGIAFRVAGKSGKNFPAESKCAGKSFQQEIWIATAFSSFPSNCQVEANVGMLLAL